VLRLTHCYGQFKIAADAILRSPHSYVQLTVKKGRLAVMFDSLFSVN